MTAPLPPPDALRAAADVLAPDHAAAADLLDRLAARIERGTPSTPDPRELRRRLLRRAWSDHFAGMTRTAAARALAAAWAAHEPGGDPPPGTLDAILDRLDRAGVRLCGWRTIADDLDPALDPMPANKLQISANR